MFKALLFFFSSLFHKYVAKIPFLFKKWLTISSDDFRVFLMYDIIGGGGGEFFGKLENIGFDRFIKKVKYKVNN